MSESVRERDELQTEAKCKVITSEEKCLKGEFPLPDPRLSLQSSRHFLLTEGALSIRMAINSFLNVEIRLHTWFRTE